MDAKGQLSAEMLVVLVIILGLAVILASTMMKSASQAAGKIEEKTSTILEASEPSEFVGKAGDYCTKNEDCQSRSCDVYAKKCL